jgi:hypothetical protein
MTNHGETSTDTLVVLSGGGGEDECDLVQGEIVKLEDISTISVIVKKPTNMKDIGPFGEDSIVNEDVHESDEPNLSTRHLLETKSDCLPCTTASINSLESQKILPAKHFEEASSNQLSITSHSPPPAKSRPRPRSRLSLQRKGRKTFSAKTKLTNPAQQLLNLDEILQSSPVLSDKILYQASTDAPPGVKLGNRIEKLQERRTKSVSVTSMRQRGEFLSGDCVWRSDDEVGRVSVVCRLDDEDWQPGEGGGKRSKKGMKRRGNVRKHLAKRKLFSIGRDDATLQPIGS